MNAEGNTRIYLIRHAQSQANASGAYTGWLDVDLSDYGVLQAQKAGGRFINAAIENVYSSALKRAHRTAQIIFGDGARIKTDARFNEINVGLFETKTHEELVREYGKLYTDWISDPTLATPPEGENIYDFYGRVISGLEDVIRESAGRSAAIVAHGGVIRCFVVYTLGMNLCDIWKVKVDNVSVSRVEFSGQRTALTLLNDTCHMKENADD